MFYTFSSTQGYDNSVIKLYLPIGNLSLLCSSSYLPVKIKDFKRLKKKKKEGEKKKALFWFNKGVVFFSTEKKKREGYRAFFFALFWSPLWFCFFLYRKKNLLFLFSYYTFINKRFIQG